MTSHHVIVKVAHYEEQKGGKMKNIGKVTTYVLLGALFVGAGIPAGIFLARTFHFDATNYSELNPKDFEDNVKGLYRTYETKHNEKTLEELVDVYKPYEIVNLAEYKAEENENLVTIGIGEVTAVANVKQTIYATQMRLGNEYFMENLSKSKFVSVAKRFYQEEDTVYSYVGELENEKRATWPEVVKEELTLEEHEEKWGKDLTRGSIYIVSSKTVLESDYNFVDGNLEVTLTLDPLYSVIRYVKQMVHVSDLSVPPTFHDVKVTYVIDENLRLLSRDIYEVYDVTSFGIVSPNTKGHLKETLYYEESLMIPSLMEHIDYDVYL